MPNESHRDLYPEQYIHPLVGEVVDVRNNRGVTVETGQVERVLPSRFGLLVMLESYPMTRTTYGINNCHIVMPNLRAVRHPSRRQIGGGR